jgi:alkaline phosphatase isozyme conversion protein
MTKALKIFIVIWIVLLLITACGTGNAPALTQEVEEPEQVEPTQIAATEPEAEPEEEAEIEATSPAAAVLSSDGQVAMKYLKALSEDIDARLPGSDEERQAAAYIADQFTAMGYAPDVQEFSFADEEGSSLNSANVMAVKAGDSTKEIVVGAHYDAVEDAQGADDNASGVAVMLETAQMLKDRQTPYTIRFIAFGAEENDLNGSRYYVEQLDETARENTVGMINLDSLLAGDHAYVYGSGDLWEWVVQFADSQGFALESRTAAELVNADGTPCDCADYSPFESAGIPFAYFEATNWELGKGDGMTQVDEQYGDGGEIRHTQYDTLEYIEETFPGRAKGYMSLFVTLLVNLLTGYH